MILASNYDWIGKFFLELAVIMVGIFVIIILTPKLAAFIDKKRGENPDDRIRSPYESAPLPERVDDDTTINDNENSNIQDKKDENQ